MKTLEKIITIIFLAVYGVIDCITLDGIYIFFRDYYGYVLAGGDNISYVYYFLGAFLFSFVISSMFIFLILKRWREGRTLWQKIPPPPPAFMPPKKDES